MCVLLQLPSAVGGRMSASEPGADEKPKIYWIMKREDKVNVEIYFNRILSYDIKHNRPL